MSGENYREQDPMNPEQALYWEPSLVNAPPPPPPDRGESSFRGKNPGKTKTNKQIFIL